MGYMRHHTIVVTDWRKEAVHKAQELAVTLEMCVSNVHISPVNAYFSFCVFPDGSKEEWSESDEGDKQRENLIDALQHNQMPYICIEYGGDDTNKICVEYLGNWDYEEKYSVEWKEQ